MLRDVQVVQPATRPNGQGEEEAYWRVSVAHALAERMAGVRLDGAELGGPIASATTQGRREARLWRGVPDLGGEMKAKPTTEERILQLTNDQAEGITSGSLREWREVARYWRNQEARQTRRLMGIVPSIAALVLARRIESHAMEEIEKWSEREREGK
jgi:hypothetical protein